MSKTYAVSIFLRMVAAAEKQHVHKDCYWNLTISLVLHFYAFFIAY